METHGEERGKDNGFWLCDASGVGFWGDGAAAFTAEMERRTSFFQKK